MLNKIRSLILKNKLHTRPHQTSQEVSAEALALKDAGDKDFKNKNFKQSIACYKKSLEFTPNQPATYNNLGIALYYTGATEDALASYNQAIELKPDYADAYNNRGILLNSLRQYPEALQSFEKAIELKPDYADAYNNQGATFYNLNRFEDALTCFAKVNALRPDFAEAYRNRGALLVALNRHNEASAVYEQAISLSPDNAEAHYNFGLTLANLNRTNEALASYETSISLKPDYADAYLAKGILLYSLKRYDEALASYDQAIASNSNSAEAYYNRGVALGTLSRSYEALESYDHAIALFSENPQFHNNRGVVLNEIKRFDEALISFNKAISLDDEYEDAHYNRGIVLNELRRFNEAIKSFDRAIELNPKMAEAYNNMGSVFTNQRQLASALSCFERAITLKPDYTQAYYNRGVTLSDLNRPQEALESFRCGLEISPSYDFLYGYWLDIKMKLCDWSDHNDNMARLASRIENLEKVTPPFLTLSQLNSRSLQRKAAEIYTQHKYPASQVLPEISKPKLHDKIRIGYFSADFRNHPLSYLIVELFETHNQAKFELICFSLGPDTKDEMRSRIAAACDQFIDVREHSDEQVSRMARAMEIDIAIDLGGYTNGCRPGIFAMRAAPLQLSYLGYLGTMGAQYIDYLIADSTIIPPAHQASYKEKILYLPSYQVNDSKRKISERVFSRAELGLPDSGFIFCCFNNNYKITPSIFNSWCNILRQVEGSVLWLLGDHQTVVENLKAEALARDIDPKRLVFANRLSYSEYLARYRVADLFLDTSPYNAGTTASDALWAGLPVLTFLGETFAGRMAASLLNAVHLTELVMSSQAEYERMAIQLAQELDYLTAIRKKLATNLQTAPLFDTKLFTQHIETAFTNIYQRYQNDQAPEHIEILSTMGRFE